MSEKRPTHRNSDTDTHTGVKTRSEADLSAEEEALRYEAVKKAAGGRRMSENYSALREIKRGRRDLRRLSDSVGRNMNICVRDYYGSFSEHTKYSGITG